MKALFTITLNILLTQPAQAADPFIYGWDILCKGTHGLKAHAYQSDDDFYVEFKGNKDDSGKPIPETKVWMDSMSQYNLNMLNLLFITSPEYSNHHTAALSITRRNSSNNQYTTGVLVTEGERHELNCFVRYGKDEQDFYEISRKPFPKLEVPVDNKT